MATEKILVEIEVVQNRLKDTEDNIKKIGGALKELKKDEENNAAAIKATESELRVYNKQLKEEQRLIDATIKAKNAKAGSIEQLKAQYAANALALNKYTIEESKSNEKAKELVAQNLRINTSLKELESSYGQNARNVGNYSQAIKPLVDNLNRLEAQMAELVIQGKGTGAEFDKLAAESKAVRDSINQVNQSVKGVTEEVKPLKTQLRELNIQMQQLAEEGKADSEMFKKLQADAGRMREVMDDVSESVKRLANNPLEITLNGIMEGARGVAAGFALAQSASVLFGEENKALQETMVTLQATMVMLNSLSEIQKILRKESALATLFETRAVIADTVAKTANAAISAILNASLTAAVAVMRLFGVTTVGTTLAVRGLALAIASTGIGLVLVGLGVLIPKIIEWTQSTDDHTKSENALKMQLEANQKVYQDTIDLIKLAGDENARVAANNIKLAKSLGASEADLLAMQQKATNERIKDLDTLRIRTIAALSNISKVNSTLISNIAKDNDALILAIENKYNNWTSIEVEFFKKLYQINQEQDNLQTDIQVAGNEFRLKQDKENKDKLLKQQEDYNKKKEAALKALKDIEDRLMSDDLQYQLNALSEEYKKEQKLIDDAYKGGLIKEEQYLKDKLFLRGNYLFQVKELLGKEVTIEDKVRQTQKTAIVNLNNQVTESLKKRDEDLIKTTQDTIDYTLFAYDESNKKIAEQQTQLVGIFTSSSQAINQAFTQSITETGFDLQKFAKSAIAIFVDVLEQLVTSQYLASIGIASMASLTSAESIATFGVAGIAKALLITGLIKAAFTGFKTAIVNSMEFGGVTPEAANGMLVGPSHAQGGIKIKTPGGMIEAEGGEAIINKKSTAMFLPQLSAINQAGGGVKFANGGMVGTMPQVDNGLMAMADMFNSMPQPVVAVTDINKVSNKMKLITVKSTL